MNVLRSFWKLNIKILSIVSRLRYNMGTDFLTNFNQLFSPIVPLIPKHVYQFVHDIPE